jgi:hypothetical protein
VPIYPEQLSVSVGLEYEPSRPDRARPLPDQVLGISEPF